MKIGIVKEIKESEYRVGAIPSAVTELTRRGHEVVVEQVLRLKKRERTFGIAST